MTINLFALPEEIILTAAEYLSGTSLVAFSETCKCARRIASTLLVKQKHKHDLHLIHRWDRFPGQKPIVEPASRHKFTLNMRKVPRYNELRMACANGDAELVSSLLRSGVSTKIPWKHAGFPAPIAQGVAVWTESYRFQTPLEAAVHNDRTEIVSMLLAADARIPREPGPLTRLVCDGNPDKETLDFLVRHHGLDINAGAANVNKVLHHMCYTGAPLPAFEWVIQNSDNLDAPDELGCSPLGSVFNLIHEEFKLHDRLAVIRLLTQHGARVDAPCDAEGRYPLHRALSDSNNPRYPSEPREALVKFLLEELQVSPNVQTPQGETALQRALNLGGHPALVRMLINAGARIDGHALETAIWSPSPSCLQVIYDEWVSQFGVKELGMLLVAAAAMGDIPKVDELFALQTTANPSAPAQGLEYNVGLALNKARDEATMDHLLSLVLQMDEYNMREAFKQAEAVAANSFFRPLKRLSAGCPHLAKAATRCTPEDMATIIETVWEIIPNEMVDHTVKTVIASKNLDAVRLVLPRLKPRTKGTGSYLNEAVKTGHVALVQAVLEWCPEQLAIVSDPQDTALSHAVKHNQPKVLEALLAAGGNPLTSYITPPNYIFSQESPMPLIQWACIHGQTEILNLLLAYGCDVNTKDEEFGRSIISWAAGEGHRDIVQILLAHGADVNATGQEGMNALGRAAMERGVGLLAAGVDRGGSALYYAAANGDVELTRLILDAGATVATGYSYDKCSLFTAAIRATLRNCLRQEGGPFGLLSSPEENAEGKSKPLLIRVCAKIGRMLLERGVYKEDPPTISVPGYQLAIDEDFAPILQVYLDHGIVGLHQVNGKGQTPLMLATISNSHAVAQLLVSAGADLFRPDNKGNTPLQMARDDQMVRILYGGISFV
ncbi:ankyrin repeat-containing domain protein [Aspergillus carlsbadensis]|nr:ankyrin repeat-containing domain protein [Aspergillus carlsbadensis]